MSSEPRKVIGSKAVDDLVPLSRVQRWRRVKAGTFPAPIEIGPNRLGWFEDEVIAWLESRPRRTYGTVAVLVCIGVIATALALIWAPPLKAMMAALS